jgi:lipopolysaccharide transport system ATP-binding protein
MSENVICVEALAKRYELGENNRYPTLRESWRGFRLRPKRRAKAGSIWALRDVSFKVKQGEVVGVIGRNGAGKSTLLKILSRITRPTTGYADINGRVASLLEVGTGFHPELTGRENIYVNGAILGMRRHEVRAKFDEVVFFAEIEEFLDTPVKRYSSGMYVRLAFAVAAHLYPDILLVDEVLAVGDAAFQRKCLNKMHEVAGGGRTVLFVSHNMAAVNALCERVLLLELGRLAEDGLPSNVTERFLAVTDGEDDYVAGVRLNRQMLNAAPQLGIRVRDVRVANPSAGDIGPRTGDPLRISVAYTASRTFVAPAFVMSIRDHLGLEVIRLSTRPISGFDLGELGAAGELRLAIDSLPLVAGRYLIDVGFVRESVEWLLKLESLVEMRVRGADVYGSGLVLDRSRGLIVVAHHWEHRTDG